MHVHWHEGLFLQPHHLQWMQRQTQLESRFARSLFVPHPFGILESRLSLDDLADGRIRFDRLRAIMPSGQEVWFPEHAQLPALDIKAEFARGGVVDVLLAVPLWAGNRGNSFRQGEQADPRIKLLYIPTEQREVLDENIGANAQVLHVRKINARFLLRDQDLSDMEFIPLLRVVRGTGHDAGKPRPDPEFVPPSVLLRSAPVLHDLMRDLAAQLSASREQFRNKAAGGGLGLETKWELLMKAMILNRYCGSLPLMIEDATITPYALYLKLRELLGELLTFPPHDTFECEPYNHLDPLRCFKQLDKRIRARIVVSLVEPLRIAFSGNPGLVRGTLEQQHFEKPNGYYLSVRTRQDRGKLAPYIVDRSKFKLMPRSLETAAVFGVELKEESSPPLDLPAQNDMHYFRLFPASDPKRWEQIRQEKALSLVWNNAEYDLSQASFTLYMTLPTGTGA